MTRRKAEQSEKEAEIDETNGSGLWRDWLLDKGTLTLILHLAIFNCHFSSAAVLVLHNFPKLVIFGLTKYNVTFYTKATA